MKATNKTKRGLPNRVKIFGNRAMIYMNGEKHKYRYVLCSLEDLEILRKYRWALSASPRAGKDRPGYAIAHCSMRRRKVLMHRLLMGEPPRGQVVDHINMTTTDNRRNNLRFISADFNIFRTENYGSEVGVSFDKRRRKWEAYMWKQNKKTTLGRFLTKDEALSARRSAEIEHFGTVKPGAK